MLPIAPLWSNFILYKISKSSLANKKVRDVTTQDTIENYMKLIKNDQGKHHFCVDKFVHLQKGYVDGRCRVFWDTIKKQIIQSRRRKLEADLDDDLDAYAGATEQWNKKVKKCQSPDKKHGIFQQPPHSPLPKYPGKVVSDKAGKNGSRSTPKANVSSYINFIQKT